MGLIIILSIFVAICAIMLFVGILTDIEILTLLGGIIGFILLVANVIVILSTCSNLLAKPAVYAQLNGTRTTLSRMLTENYNPENLQKALDFNYIQKVTKVENEHLWTRYNTNVVYVDTITIPVSQFMPTDKHIISPIPVTNQ